MTDDGFKRYTLRTRADDDQLRETVCSLAARTRHPAFLSQQEGGSERVAETLLIEVRPQLRQPWTRQRWLAALFANAGISLLFYLVPDIRGITGYLMGFSIACLILMW